MDPQRILDLQTTYDRVAQEYTRRISDELKDKPLDRQLLDRLAEQVRARGVICDLGCGPGQIARYLSERGAQVVGVDLSAGMLEQARRFNPGLDFRQGDMGALDFPEAAWAGIAAFYSIIHIPRQEVVGVLQELRRVLQPDGLLLVAFHIGEELTHLDEWWGQPVSADFFYFQPQEMAGYLSAAGFAVEEVIERAPYPEVEHQSRRAYIFARKPLDS